jgi:D-alanine-D-alanine ligase
VPLPDRVRLIVLFGGRSAEHDVSRVSASHVMRAVDPDRYEVVPVGITRDGEWRLAAGAAELMSDGKHRELPGSIDIDGPAAAPLPMLSSGGTDAPAALDPEALDPSTPTVVLPVLHGPNGEDGTVQGLLELADVPYVGSGVLGSAVAMDKAMAKTVLAAEGIAQPGWHQLRPGDVERDPALVDRLLLELGPTLFVKPANMGSSIGVSKTHGPSELLAALDVAFGYDDVAVVEEAVDARELECAVLGNDEPRASVVGEIVPGADFYDYQDKYAAGIARTVIPAELDDATMRAARELAVRTFRALRAEGMARVDMFLVGDELMVNEINTIPGFTPISMYPMLWEASGLSYPALIDELVSLALERHARRARHSTEPTAP